MNRRELRHVPLIPGAGPRLWPGPGPPELAFPPELAMASQKT